MLIRQILLVFIGLASGLAIAGGIFAFITWIGIVTRLAKKTNTAAHIMLYEDMVVLGACFGNLIYLYNFRIPLGIPGVIIFGLFSGIFEGCLSVAIAEVIQTFPIFASRTKIKIGFPYILLSLALGKGVGTIIQIYI
jgi:stage V sporulation protein AB